MHIWCYRHPKCSVFRQATEETVCFNRYLPMNHLPQRLHRIHANVASNLSTVCSDKKYSKLKSSLVTLCLVSQVPQIVWPSTYTFLIKPFLIKCNLLKPHRLFFRIYYPFAAKSSSDVNNQSILYHVWFADSLLNVKH